MRSLLILLMLSLTACNVVEMMERKAQRSFDRAGLQEVEIAAENGVRHVWRSPSTDKPDLMLVHGITAKSTMWSKNVKRLSKDFDLILPDLIGHGGTTVPWEGSSVDAQVEHLAIILDSLHVRTPVHVVGNSYGGAMAAVFAERHPEMVRALIIYDGPASDFTVTMADSIARSVGATDVMDLFSPNNADEQRRLLDLSVHSYFWIPQFALRQFNAHMQAKQPGYLALLKDLLKHETEYVGKSYAWPMPVYVFWGEHDRLIPLQVGKNIAKRNNLDEDHLIIIPEAGHVANIEQAKVFEAHVLRVFGTNPLGL